MFKDGELILRIMDILEVINYMIYGCDGVFLDVLVTKFIRTNRGTKDIEIGCVMLLESDIEGVS